MITQYLGDSFLLNFYFYPQNGSNLSCYSFPARDAAIGLGLPFPKRFGKATTSRKSTGPAVCPRQGLQYFLYFRVYFGDELLGGVGQPTPGQ